MYNQYDNYEYRRYSDDQKDFTWRDIPKMITGFFKFFFWIKFLYVVGILHLIAPRFSTDKEIQEQQSARIEISRFLDQKLKEVDNKVAHGNNYSPQEYFETLRAINQLEDSAGFSGFDNRIMEIQRYMHISISAGAYTYDDVDKARTWFYQHPIVKHQHKPKPVSPHVCNKYIHHLSWSAVPQWIWYIYKQMFLYVFFLLLIWVYQKKDSPTLSLRSPLSFILLILIHPIYMMFVIVRSWREGWREFSAGVELRRRKKNIFEKFSQEERLAIRAFARSAVNFKEFVIWAERLGARKNLTFFAVVAVIVSSINLRVEAKTTVLDAKDVKSVVTASYVHSDSVDYDVGRSVSTDKAFFYDLYQWAVEPVVQVSVQNAKNLHFLLSNGYLQKQEPVPIGY